MREAGLLLTDEEVGRLEVAELGLNEFDTTGLVLFTYVNNEVYCAKELIMFPNQTCPEHRHPPVAGGPERGPGVDAEVAVDERPRVTELEDAAVRERFIVGTLALAPLPYNTGLLVAAVILAVQAPSIAQTAPAAGARLALENCLLAGRGRRRVRPDRLPRVGRAAVRGGDRRQPAGAGRRDRGRGQGPDGP